MTSTISSQPLLGPVVAMAVWTLVQEVWLFAVRIPAINKYKIDMNPERAPADMKKKFPAHLQWPADNFNNLHEQPTFFVAVTLALNALGVTDRTSVGLAWGYIGLRVIHSLVHSTVNVIPVRGSLFMVSSVTLAALTGKAALIVFGGGSSHLEL